jgi:hypothetical protein
MENGYGRKVTRSPVWPETEAMLKYSDAFDMKAKRDLTIQGGVGDLGSSGMFFLTNEIIPLNAAVEITINFDPKSSSPDSSLSASGQTVRTTPEGVGIKFTSIDLKKLQKCIVSKINR